MARMLAGGTTCWPKQEGCQGWVPEKDHLASHALEMAEGPVYVYLLQTEENRPFPTFLVSPPSFRQLIQACLELNK